MTPGQELAIEQLSEIESVGDDALEILSTKLVGESSQWVQVEVSVYCGDMERSPDGLPLRTRERFFLYILPDFPFEVPSAWTSHTRFAGYAHVQWKRHLCVYQAPQTEWAPSDGMFGFMTRLDEWLRQGALGQLDPIGAPLHPPVAYTSTRPVPSVIPRVDTPSAGESGWFGMAHLNFVSDSRVDIYGWSPLFAEKTARSAGAAILLPKALPFEFPSKVGALLGELETRGVPRKFLLLTLEVAVLHNDEDAPLFVIIGTPMRGIRGSEDLRQHLTAWYIDAVIARALRLAINKYARHEKLQEIGKKAEAIVLDWARDADAAWCPVHEDRPEIVTRRDHEAPLSWFRGRVVSVWGCGALGGVVAEFLTRVGVGRLILRDNKIVTPGILVRQQFVDSDIGLPKAEVLAQKLSRIRPDLQVEAHTQNLIKEPLGGGNWTDNADVIIDTTASETVVEKLELVRGTQNVDRVPVVSMVVGHRAERGLVVLAKPGHSGGPFDVTRRAKLEACDRGDLRDYAEEFWPVARRQNLFQPEPGCSDPTFVGSAADVAALVGMMLNQVARDLCDETSATASAHFLSQPCNAPAATSALHASFSWEPDIVCKDPQSGYEIRIAEAAWSKILEWIRRSQRHFGSRVETGGVLFGERNEAERVVWVSEVVGPPPDSQASATGFVCGVVGTAEANDERRKRTRHSVQCVGVWHTHPESAPLPSPRDLNGMARIVTAIDPPTPKSLLLIVGGEFSEPTIGTFLFSRLDFANINDGIYTRRCSVRAAPVTLRPRRKNRTLSATWARTVTLFTNRLGTLAMKIRRLFRH